MEQGTANGDIAAGDPPSDLASSIPALILPTPADGPDPPSDLASNVPVLILPTPADGPDPPSDLASSIPTLSLPTPDGPALSDPTPDGFPHSPDDYFLHPPGWLESPDPSLQIVAAPASPISVLAASESLSDVVIPATLQSQPDQSFLLLSLPLLSFTVT